LFPTVRNEDFAMDSLPTDHSPGERIRPSVQAVPESDIPKEGSGALDLPLLFLSPPGKVG